MRTAEEYFQDRNGGKPSSEMNEYLVPTWCVRLMEDYTAELRAELDQLRRERDETFALLQKEQQARIDGDSSHFKSQDQLATMRGLLGRCVEVMARYNVIGHEDYQERQQLLQDISNLKG